MAGQRRWTVTAPPSIKLVSTTTCKIVTEMCVVVSTRSYAVRTRPQVRQQCIVKSPFLLSTLVLISLYKTWSEKEPQPRDSLITRTCVAVSPNKSK